MNVYSTCPWGFLSTVMRNVWYLTSVSDNKSKQTNKKTWIEPWDFLFSSLWAGCHFTLGEAVYTSVFLSWRCSDLLNTSVWFLIILEESVFILMLCFLDLPILLPFWFGPWRNPPIAAFPMSLYLAFSILCGTFFFLPVWSQHILMSETFRELAWCIVLLLRQKHIILKLESTVHASWREEEKRNYKPSILCGGLFFNLISSFILHISEFIETGFFICLCILSPYQMIWSYVATLIIP